MLSTIFAATKSVPNAKKYMIIGVILGIIFSCILAVFTNNIANSFDGRGQEIFNIIIVTSSITMIGWTVIWMRKRANKFKNNLDMISQEINQGRVLIYSLPLLVTILMLREGVEIVLFTYSILAVESISTKDFIIAATCGIGSGIIVGITLYMGLTRSSSRLIFKITSWLLIFIAANLASELANILNAIGLLSKLEITAWNSSNIIADQSYLGKILNIVLGYHAQPSVLQVLLYFGTVFCIIFSDKFSKQSMVK